jgi:hypothetical protein
MDGKIVWLGLSRAKHRFEMGLPPLTPEEPTLEIAADLVNQLGQPNDEQTNGFMTLDQAQPFDVCSRKG